MFCLYWYYHSGLSLCKTSKMHWFLPFAGNFSVRPGCHYPGLQDSVFHLPTPFSKPNNASARNNSPFVSKAADDLFKCDSWYYYHSKLDNPVELHVLSFPGLFRLDNVSRIRSNDIFFNGGFMVMKVPKSENVQPSWGDKVVISELPSRACPVMLLKKYLAKF